MIEGIQGDNNSSAFNIIDTAVAGKQNALEFNAPIPSGTSYIELTTLKDGNIYYRLMGGGGGGGTWGSIVGTLSDQTDLQNALNAKANTFAPTFTGSVNVTGSIFVNYNTSTSSGKEVATKQDITNALVFATAEEIDALDYESPSLNSAVQDIIGGSY